MNYIRNDAGQFVKGIYQKTPMPIGTIRIRTRHKRGGDRRAFIKIAEPQTWILLARYHWEQAHGPIPRGYGIHHKDENPLNDALDNLELVSKSRHLSLHREAFQHKSIAALQKALQTKTWERVSPEHRARILAAAQAYKHGEGSLRALAQRFHVGLRSISEWAKRL